MENFKHNLGEKKVIRSVNRILTSGSDEKSEKMMHLSDERSLVDPDDHVLFILLF